MELRVISSDEVSQLLPMEACIGLMEQTFSNLAQGLCLVPQRQSMWLPEKQGLLGIMPAHDAWSERFGAKLMSVFPRNHALGLASHQGVVMLFDEKGAPRWPLSMPMRSPPSGRRLCLRWPHVISPIPIQAVCSSWAAGSRRSNILKPWFRSGR